MLKPPSMPIEQLREMLEANRLRQNMLLCPPMVAPKAWLYRLSASANIEFCIVTFTVGSLV